MIINIYLKKKSLYSAKFVTSLILILSLSLLKWYGVIFQNSFYTHRPPTEMAFFEFHPPPPPTHTQLKVICIFPNYVSNLRQSSSVRLPSSTQFHSVVKMSICISLRIGMIDFKMIKQSYVSIVKRSSITCCIFCWADSD